VVSAVAIKGEDAEAIEFEILSTCQLVGKPLMDIKFPRQALIAAIVRDGTVIIPGGMDVIQPGDHIIIFTKREAVHQVEKALLVKMELFS
jgi:trk system potassium uptake protein TrkA